MEAFKQFKKHAVVVYVDTKKPTSRENLSPLVMSVLNAASMGNTIPKAVVTSADQKDYMASISYKKMQDKKSFREANKNIKEALGGKTIAKPKDAELVWTLAGSSRYYRGSFVAIKDGKDLIIKGPNGKNIKVPMAKLTKGSQAYAHTLAGTGGDVAEKKAEFEVETWTNNKGKNVRAKFVSLKGNKVTLDVPGMKKVTLDISTLSEKSQKRAKELASK